MKPLFAACLFASLVAAAPPGRAAPACPPPLAQPTPEMIQQAVQSARDRGFLWRASKDGHTSYLYGTMHIGKLDWSIPGPSVSAALRAVDTVALELDMLDPAIQQQMADALAAMRPAALPPDLQQRLRRQAVADCIPYESVAKLAPEFQIITLALAMARRDGLEASYAADFVLAGVGHAAQKPVVSLETVAAQMRLLESANAQEAEATVRDGLDQLENGEARAVLVRLANTWANGDFADMNRYDDWCRCRETEIAREMMRRVLDERNPGLAERIDALHRGGKNVFAAVGTLHLIGENSLPALLRVRGYDVERVNYPAR